MAEDVTVTDFVSLSDKDWASITSSLNVKLELPVSSVSSAPEPWNTLFLYQLKV